MRKTFAALTMLLALAACSSLPLSTANRLRSLDALNDDLASLLIAFDVPLSLEPIPDGSTFSFDITTPASGARHIKAVLIETGADDLAGTLPPPADVRNYFLFGFSEPDKVLLREAQAWAKTLPPGANALSISLAPDFCRTAEIDLARDTVAVLVALPGTIGLAPLIGGQPLKALLAATPGKAVPPCAGHSG